MMDSYDEYVSKKHNIGKKHGHGNGKKNLKSKFTTGIRNIFHHPKPIKRAASMPMLNNNDPVEGLGVYPIHAASVETDITLRKLSEKKFVHRGLSRDDSRPTSACFTYPVGVKNGSVPAGTGNTPFPAKQNFHGNLDDYHANDTIRVGHLSRQERAKLHFISKTDSMYGSVDTGKIDVHEKRLPSRDDVDANNNNYNNNTKKVPTPYVKVLSQTSEIPRSFERLQGTNKDNQQRSIKTSNLYKNIDQDKNKKIKNELTSLTQTNNKNSDIQLKVKQPTSSSTSSSKNEGVPSETIDRTNGSSRNEKKVRSPTRPTISTIRQLTASDSIDIPNTSKANSCITERDGGNYNYSSKRTPAFCRSLSQDGHPRLISRRGSSELNGMVCALDKSALQTIIHEVTQLLLVDKNYDEKLVTRWCKDICVKVRDRLLRVNELRHKVVVNAHIASKTRTEDVLDAIHVATGCQAHASNDRFVTVALEGEDLYVWVTVLLLHY